MLELIAAVISAVVGLVTKAMGLEQQAQAEITAGYTNDQNFEQTKTLSYYQLLSESKRNTYIIIGLVVTGVLVVAVVLLLNKKKA